MPGSVVLIWDYDGAIGQVNATYPYLFDEEKIIQEICNVDTILELGQEYGITMTFACLGFAAEHGHFPYHVPEQIKKIHDSGHEIASHSWKHEWFPYLEREQIVRSLTRSKYALEQAIGVDGAVAGFVPPFSRPMSWYAKGAVSLGDRVFGPWYPGGDLGSLLKLVAETGYRWCRVSYRSLLRKMIGASSDHEDVSEPWQHYKAVTCVPAHYVGFDERACQLLENVNQNGGTLVVSGHPSGLSRNKEESLHSLIGFMQKLADYQKRGTLRTISVSQKIVDG
jgi:peptidoglycan/xylan/chitin deacetylase (PgdA/CDA1 family)